MVPPRDAVLRWAVNIANWDPQTAEWTFLLKLLSDEEVLAVEKFKFADDRKRALVSRSDTFTVPLFLEQWLRCTYAPSACSSD